MSGELKKWSPTTGLFETRSKIEQMQCWGLNSSSNNYIVWNVEISFLYLCVHAKTNLTKRGVSCIKFHKPHWVPFFSSYVHLPVSFFSQSCLSLNFCKAKKVSKDSFVCLFVYEWCLNPLLSQCCGLTKKMLLLPSPKVSNLPFTTVTIILLLMLEENKAWH